MHIFRHIFLSNYWWAEIWYLVTSFIRYPISWVAFLDPSYSYFLFADFVDLYTHWTYILYMPIFRHIFLSNCWWHKSDIWSQASYRYPISWVAFLDPSYSYFLFADFVDFYTHWTYMLIFCRIFLGNYWWQKSDIWSQASYSNLYRGKRFWTHHIPTSCLPTLLICIHIEHTFCICPFFVAFFSATVDGRNLIFGHKLHIGTPYRG